MSQGIALDAWPGLRSCAAWAQELFVMRTPEQTQETHRAPPQPPAGLSWRVVGSQCGSSALPGLWTILQVVQERDEASSSRSCVSAGAAGLSGGPGGWWGVCVECCCALPVELALGSGCVLGPAAGESVVLRWFNWPKCCWELPLSYEEEEVK